MSQTSDNNEEVVIPEEVERLAKQVVDAAFRVHTKLGPGLLERVYEECLIYELKKKGLKVEQQVLLPIVYDELHLENALRIDILVENCIVIELKAVEVTLPVHKFQVLTYLKLSGHRLGFLINFNVPFIKEGIKRLVRG